MKRGALLLGRFLVAAAGAWAAWILFVLIEVYWQGPPRPQGGWCPLYLNVWNFSWLDRDPLFSAATSAANLVLFILGALLVFFRPRWGFFLSGMGFWSYLILSFMSSVPEIGKHDYYIPWSDRILLIMGPPALLSFVAGWLERPVEDGNPLLRIRALVREIRSRPMGSA